MFSVVFSDNKLLSQFSGFCSSLVADFLIKSTGKGHVNDSLIAQVPLPSSSSSNLFAQRALRLNCLTSHYTDLWAELWPDFFRDDPFRWAKSDRRLCDAVDLPAEWTVEVPLRTAFERRQALVELDALAALSLDLTANELCTIYRVQFPVLRQYERKTFYDQRGHIVFTVSKGLTGVGLARKEWEQIQKALPGDTLPEFAQEYVPPFDSCDREEDMRQAYAFFQDVSRE